MCAVHESNIAESVMPGRLVAGPWILNPGRRTFESGLLSRLGSQFFDNLKFPLRPMAGRCALNAEIVVQVHGREPELWSIGRMADRLSAGTGSIPVSSTISLREIRPAARTLASRSSYEGSSPSSPAKGEHGIAAGASGLQPDDASSTLAARSMIFAEVV